MDVSETRLIVEGAKQLVAVPTTYPKSIQLLLHSKQASEDFILATNCIIHQIPSPPHTPIDTDSCQFPTITASIDVAIVKIHEGRLPLKKSISQTMFTSIPHTYPIWQVGIILVMKHNTEIQIADNIPAELAEDRIPETFPIKKANST